MIGRIRKWRVLRLALALGFVGTVWACNAPFIPVPPPAASFSAAVVTSDSGAQQTVWTTIGHPGQQAAAAKFFIFDSVSGNGAIVRANDDGSYRAPPFTGTAGDRVYIYYETTNGETSETDCRQLVGDVDPAPLCPQ